MLQIDGAAKSNKSQRMRDILRALLGQSVADKKSAHLIGVHDTVSARIGVAAGFEALWASGLGLSAVMGRCDRDEISWLETADAAEMIAESVDVPLLLDGNDGMGGVNVARLFARKVARRGVAGVSIEDKAWPRKNSLDGSQALLSSEEFAYKISSCRDHVDIESFVIVARTDALIAGESTSATVKRAENYAKAGADAVIVHSKHSSPSELAEFMKDWSQACPIIAIPTTYPHVPDYCFDNLGVAAVIWANQLMRASIVAMQQHAQLIVDGALSGRNPGGTATLDTLLNLSNCGCCSPMKLR